MARAISDEEIQLKRRARRRLIGAIVLVMAIIVVLPMVLDSEPKTADQEIKVQIPSTNSGAFTSNVVPVPPRTDGKPEGKPEGKTEGKTEAKPAPKDSKAAPEAPVPGAAPAVPNEASKGAPKSSVAAAPAEKPAVVKEAVKEAPAVSNKETAKETAKPEAPKPTLKAETELPKPVAAKPEPKKVEAKKAKAAAKESAKTANGKFVVQVIALADADRAKQMQGKIAAAGIKSYTEVVRTAKGDVTRVRAGPFATRQQAEKAREQLKALGMSGNIATR
jgi:DedD protein